MPDTKPTPTVIDSDRKIADEWYRCGCGATYETIMESEPTARQRQRHARPDGDHHHVADEVESMASQIAAAREAWGAEVERRVTTEYRQFRDDWQSRGLRAEERLAARADAVAGLVDVVEGLLIEHDRGELPLHRVIEALRAALERVKGVGA